MSASDKSFVSLNLSINDNDSVVCILFQSWLINVSIGLLFLSPVGQLEIQDLIIFNWLSSCLLQLVMVMKQNCCSTADFILGLITYTSLRIQTILSLQNTKRIISGVIRDELSMSNSHYSVSNKVLSRRWISIFDTI